MAIIPIRMQDSIRQVYFLSNGTAITAETLGHSLLAQFPSMHFRTKTIPFIDTAAKARAVIDEIDRDIVDANELPIVISTMADLELKEIIDTTGPRATTPCAGYFPAGAKNLPAGPAPGICFCR